VHNQFNPWASDDQQGSGQREWRGPQPGQSDREDPPGQFGQPGYDHEEPGFNRQGYVPHHPYQPPAGDHQEWFDTTPVPPIGRHPAADQAFTERERIEREIAAVAAHGVAEPPPGRGRRLPGPIGLAAVVTALLVIFGAGAALLSPTFTGGDGGSGSDVLADAGVADAGLAVPTEPATPEPTPSTSTPAPSPTAAAALTPKPERSTAKPRPKPSTAKPRSATTAREDRVTALVNQERARAGCGTVRTNAQLRTAARRHSQDMADRNYFSHDSLDGRTPWDRAEAAGYQRAIGENIAKGQATPEAVMAAWMDSPGHRRNILNCDARATGVGLAFDGATPIWTQLFGAV